MENIGVSVVTNILNKLVDTGIGYLLRFNRYVKELETQKHNLQSKIEAVIDRANEAKKKTEKVVSGVEKWLYEADSLIAKAEELEEKTKNRSKTCCLKYCPNLAKRYSLAKQVEGKTNEIITHCQIEFPEFSRLATLVGMSYFSSEGFIHFDSRQMAYDGLLEALKDDQVHMMGLYGMGGCGKTTLAKEVGKEAEQVFNKVIFVVVSINIEVRKIQGKIASQLDNLKLGEEEEPERARRLFMRLSSGEKFLIILDDVWEKLDFEAIGIPLLENHKGCTILITTRKFQVCRLMSCKRIIHLKNLNEDEAWVLFQKHAGTFDESSYPLTSVAQKITKECGGLPIAIAAVASTLKGKPQVEWDEALKTLRDSSLVDIEEGFKIPYTCLRLSYDKLENEAAKSLFLLCSVFPEDYEIPIDQLIIIGVGLGLVGEVHSYQRARNQLISKGKNKLIDSCLLLKVDGNSDCIKMHDLVRDVALWIAKKEIKLMMKQERSQKALKESMILNDDIVRYLWFDEVDAISLKLDCPQLEFLSISSNVKFPIDLTNVFLKGMEKLRVLILKNKSFFDISINLRSWKSVHLINNLCCLILCSWLLEDISFIGSLNRLESLTLWHCSFNELPKFIAEQKNLRLLDVWRCKIQRNPYEVIGRCSQLEVLYFIENEGDWMDQGTSVDEFFDNISVTSTLESYCINFGKIHDVHFERLEFPITRSIYVEDFESCVSNATIKDLMQRAEVLALGGIHGSYKSVIPDVFQAIGGGMHALTQLSLLYSDQIEHVIDPINQLGQVGIISNLTHLTIDEIKHLKSVCHGQPLPGLFARLQILEIYNCNSLKHIIADEGKEIAAVDDSEYQRSCSFAFPNLKKLIIYWCSQLEYLMPISFAQSLVQLEVLDIRGSENLKSVFGQSIYEDPSPSKIQFIQFSALTNLTLVSVPNIISICPKNYHPTWPSLKSLKLQNCPQLNTLSINHWIVGCGLRQRDDEIVSENLLKAVVTPLETLRSVDVNEADMEVIYDVEGLPSTAQQVNSTIQQLQLYHLPQLRHIWRGPKNLLLLQNLGKLIMQKCPNLIVIFPASVFRSFPQLKELHISHCKKLEEIIEEDQNVSNPHRQLVFPNLTIIIIEHCHKLKQVFPVSACFVLPKLRILWIEDASQLEQVIRDEKGKTLMEKKQNINVIPNLEYAILWKLPTLTAEGQCFDFQTVRYLIVDQCPRLTLTSTIHPQELLQKLEIQEGYSEDRWRLMSLLINIVESNKHRSRKTSRQITSKDGEVESPSESDHITWHAQNNELKLTHFASNLTEEAQDSENRCAQGTNLLEERSVKGSIEEVATLENTRIISSSTHSETTSSLLDSLVSSLPERLPREMVNETSANKSSVRDQQQSFGETDIHNNEIPRGIKGVIEMEDQTVQERITLKENDVKGSFEGSTSENPKIVTSSTQSSSRTGILVASLPKALPHIQSQINERETDVDKDMKANPVINLQDLKGDDLNSLLQSMEEDCGGESPISSVPVVADPKDKLVAKALVDLEESVKMPLKDIATSEANSLRLQTALNFLSCLSLEDGAPSHGLTAIIKSLRQDLPSILYSFKQAFATANKFAVLEERDKSIKEELAQREEAAIALVSKMSETQKFINEAQEKEARLKELISWLEKEITAREAELSSLEELKKKYVEEIVGFKKEFETVRKEKFEMVEHQRNAQQQLFQVDHKWSVLCSQFEQSIADRDCS